MIFQEGYVFFGIDVSLELDKTFYPRYFRWLPKPPTFSQFSGCIWGQNAFLWVSGSGFLDWGIIREFFYPKIRRFARSRNFCPKTYNPSQTFCDVYLRKKVFLSPKTGFQAVLDQYLPYQWTGNVSISMKIAYNLCWSQKRVPSWS